MVFSELLHLRAASNPDGISVISGQERLTYAQLLTSALAIASSLPSAPATTPLALTATLSLPFFVVLSGALIAEVPVLLEHPHETAERRDLLRKTARVGGVMRLSDECPLRWWVEPFQSSAQEAESLPSLSTPAILIATSGSSGTPKIIPLMAHHLLESARRVNQRLTVTPDSVWLLSLMPAHIGGFSIVARALVAGCALVIPPDLKRRHLHQIAQEHRVSHLSLVPSVAQEFLEIGPLPSSLSAILLGGERLTHAQRNTLSSVPECFLSYGATETASCIALARLSEIAHLPDAVGYPLRDTVVTIRNERGDPNPAGEVGMVEISGPTISAAESDPLTGYRIWRSADRGYLSESGLLHILGRADEVIISGGVKIDAHEIVDAAISSTLITEATVIKTSDSRWGERAVLFVTAPETTSAERLSLYLRSRLGGTRAPREIVILTSFPRTAIGKINRARLRLYADGGEDNETRQGLIREHLVR